ncbi:MAG: biotin/lipoyl-containing protein, partial [Anaerolineaceae bacterium]
AKTLGLLLRASEFERWLVSEALDVLIADASRTLEELSAGQYSFAFDDTNRDFLVNTLRHPAFLAGDTTTDFIDRHEPGRRREPEAGELTFALFAAALTASETRTGKRKVLDQVQTGWRNNRSSLQTARYAFRGTEFEVGYAQERDGMLTCTIGDTCHAVRRVATSKGRATLEIDGVRRTGSVLVRDHEVWVQTTQGEIVLREIPRFPEATRQALASGYAAPMPGKVVSVHTQAGAVVKAGDLLIILEAMKMEHRITAGGGATVAEVRVLAGEQVEAGQILLVMEGESVG